MPRMPGLTKTRLALLSPPVPTSASPAARAAGPGRERRGGGRHHKDKQTMQGGQGQQPQRGFGARRGHRGGFQGPPRMAQGPPPSVIGQQPMGPPIPGPAMQQPLFVPGTASLREELDKKVLVVLRDGRKLVGYLRSFDQFANLALEDCVERFFVDDMYGEIERGVFLIRGENVVLLAELDEQKELSMASLKKLSEDQILEAQLQQKEAREKDDQQARKVLLDRGLAPDTVDDLKF